MTSLLRFQIASFTPEHLHHPDVTMARGSGAGQLPSPWTLKMNLNGPNAHRDRYVDPKTVS